MLKPLNPLFLSELRLAIMSLLNCVEEADFLYLKEQTGATAGNLSVQLDKLSKAGYIEIEKGFAGKRPRTSCRITTMGEKAFLAHYQDLLSYFDTDSVDEDPDVGSDT